MILEFFQHYDPQVRKWLTTFFNDILNRGKIPPIFKNTKIIAISKPGNPKDLPQSYHPIALLNVTYKLLEKLMYNRISPIIDYIISVEPAGFRPNRNCTD